MEPRSWSRTDETTGEKYMVSSRREDVSVKFVTDAFAAEEMYWAKPLPEPEMIKMLDNSLNFSLFAKTESTAEAPAEMQMIGLARLITDYVTLAYLTDVYVLEEYRGKGLAGWLVGCCQEVLEAFGESFRRSVLMATHADGVKFYGKHLRAHVHVQDVAKGALMTWKRGDMENDPTRNG